MKSNYFDNDEKVRKKPKKRKKKKLGKIVLTVLSLIIVALAVFVITIKVLRPDFDFTSLIPEKAVAFVSEEILGDATTEPPATEKPTATKPTTEKLLDYLAFKEFEFHTEKQGNYLGNLLNGGSVATDFTYIYHIADGSGIYRFYPSSESYTRIYKSNDKLSCLNLRGDYLYFVDEDNGKLYKLRKGTEKPRTVAENVRFAYVYDSLVYFITNSNALCVMDVKELKPVTIYYSADRKLDFIGISKERVFFSVTEDGGETKFLSIDNFARAKACRFRENSNSVLYPVMENGFLYFYEKQSDLTYNLCRQKFGSKKVVTLIKNASAVSYPAVDSNRLYYAELDGSEYRMKELNMNSENKKTLLSASDVDENDLPCFFHGGEYDFIIGENVYSASSMFTSSTNVMKFKNGNWKY